MRDSFGRDRANWRAMSCCELCRYFGITSMVSLADDDREADVGLPVAATLEDLLSRFTMVLASWPSSARRPINSPQPDKQILKLLAGRRTAVPVHDGKRSVYVFDHKSL